MPPLIWEPNDDFVKTSYLSHFRKAINQKHNLSLQSYQDLHKFSIDRPNDFWMALWDFLPVKASRQPTHAVDESARIDDFPEFYPGSRLNYAENLLSRTGSAIAVKALSEDTLSRPEEVSWDGVS